MARNTFGGYMGHQIGKLGTSVGYVIDGIQFYRAYTANVRNPRTAAQQLQRAKIGVLGQTARAFRVATSIGFMKSRKKLANVISMFTSVNYPNVSGSTPESVTLDISALQLSLGSLPQPGFDGRASCQEALKIDVAMNDDASFPGASASDKVYLVAYQADLNQAVIGTPVVRTNNKAIVMVPEFWSGMEAHVYGFAKSEQDAYYQGVKVMTAGESSQTTYLGSVNVI